MVLVIPLPYLRGGFFVSRENRNNVAKIYFVSRLILPYICVTKPNKMKKYTFIFFSSKSDDRQERTVLAGDVSAAKQYFLDSLRINGHEEIRIIATVMPQKQTHG